MGLAPEVKLVVKRTFLEFVEKGCSQEPRFRAFTDTALFADYESSASSSQSEAGDTEDSAILPISTFSTPCLGPATDPVPLPTWADLCMADAFPWLPQATSQPESVQVCMAWMPMNTHSEVDYRNMSMSINTAQATEICMTPATSSTAATRVSDPDHPTNTTLMLRGLPETCTRDVLLGMLDHLGFAGEYDLVYVPVNFATEVGLRYAFVNAVSPASARRLWACFDGFQAWPMLCEEVCTVCWSEPHQGVSAHVERYRNSPVMHESVPESWKPALFQRGLRVPFPSPTRAIKAPKAPRNRH